MRQLYDGQLLVANTLQLHKERAALKPRLIPDTVADASSCRVVPKPKAGFPNKPARVVMRLAKVVREALIAMPQELANSSGHATPPSASIASVVDQV